MERLAALALPWAKQYHPDKYEETVGVSDHPAAFTARCVRLIELHADADPAWARGLPLSVLEQTAIRVRFRHRPTGTILEVQGRRAPGPRRWSFLQLNTTPEDFAAMVVAADLFDLEHVPHA